jgi:hypothetical protein
MSERNVSLTKSKGTKDEKMKREERRKEMGNKDEEMRE